MIAGLLLFEKAILSSFVDSGNAQKAHGLRTIAWTVQHLGFRFLVSFGISIAVFAYLRAGRELREADLALRAAPVRARWLVAHCAFVAALVPLSISLYDYAARLPLLVVVAVWFLVAALAAGALLAAFAPWPLWRAVARALGSLWSYAGIAGAAAVLMMGWSQNLWVGMADITFEAVYGLLQWLIPSLHVDSAHRIIDTGRFAVVIDPVCSGLEGMGLMVVFCTVLLLLFRQEYVFPRALLLIPAALLLSFVLNVARIATLVLIGDGGFATVAIYGFHSQAGWIAFNAAAVGVALVSLRSPWFNRAARAPAVAMTAENPTAVYLLPYLALILGGMVSKAASGGFESLYWLRLLAAAAALGYSLPRLHDVDWRFSWRGGVAGLAAFAAWIITAQVLLARQGMPAALAALSPTSRAAWIGGHILVSVAVIPLAEELAFRGYLLRRIQAPDFESLVPKQVSGLALVVSAVIFGLCQGVFWLPGMITGLVFGLVYMRTGRLGEAIAAHVTGNALIAGLVLGGSQWQLW